MNQMFVVSSYKSVGCTFLDWSIYYLSGQQQFYNVEQQQWIPLSVNPINNINAHGHFKNHPQGLEETQTYLNHLLNINGLTSCYPYSMSIVDAAEKFQIEINNGIEDDDFAKIHDAQKNEYNQILNLVATSPVKLIYIDLSPESILYTIENRSTESTVLKNPQKNKQYTKQQQQIDYETLFFKNSADTWKNLNLTSIWDQREHQALCTRPFDISQSIAVCVDSTHLRLDSRLWWTAGEFVIKKVFDYLSLSLDIDRFSTWRSIYQQWQQPRLKSLEFIFNHQHIVNCIVNNLWCEIDLSFEQEVVIQHCLIYQHNLNLKTWGLKKFPNNTKLLHQLLEPNIHPIA